MLESSFSLILVNYIDQPLNVLLKSLSLHRKNAVEFFFLVNVREFVTKYCIFLWGGLSLCAASHN